MVSESLAPNPDWDVSDGCLGGQTDHDNDDGDVGIKYHYHPRLRVIVDGEDLQIPSNTGIDQNGCKGGMRWIHVHSSGVANNQAFRGIHSCQGFGFFQCVLPPSYKNKMITCFKEC